MTDISIIVPFYNAWHHTHQVLMDLYKTNQGRYEIILVNDASTEPDVHKGLKWWRDLGAVDFKVANREQNGGFGEAMNYGVEKSSGDIVILLSNDVRILSTTYDLGKEIKSVLDLQPESLVGGQIVDWEAGWNQFGDLVIPYLYGWLIACKRKVWDELGGFDPIYKPYDYEEKYSNG